MNKPTMQFKTSKTFQKAGRWIERPTRSEILTCNCGSKFVKTRDGQKLCIKCLGKVLAR